MPSRIRAMLAGGWNESASAKRQRKRLASSDATVVLPLPATPMTIITEGAIARPCPASRSSRRLLERGFAEPGVQPAAQDAGLTVAGRATG